MPEMSMSQAVAGLHGPGAKHHGVKGGAALPTSAAMFFQVLSGRLDAGVPGISVSAEAGGAAADKLALQAEAGLTAGDATTSAASAKSTAAAKAATTEVADAAIMAQFAAQLPAQAAASQSQSFQTAPLPDEGAIAATDGDATPSHDPLRAVLQAMARPDAMAHDQPATGQGTEAAPEVAPEAVVETGSAEAPKEGKDDPLAAFLNAMQDKRSGQAAPATSAGDGQLLPAPGAAKAPNGAPLDPARGAAARQEAGMDLTTAQASVPPGKEAGANAPAQVAVGTSAAPLDTLPAGTPQADATPAGVSQVRPFDHLLRTAEAKVHVAVEAPVRSSGFPAEFGEKIVWLAGRQGQWAELSLTPPHLGTVEVRLSMTGGEAGAQFYSANPSVREAMEAALPKLRELMAEAGINLGQASVRDEGFAQRDGVENPAQGMANPDGEVAGTLQQQADPSFRAPRARVGLVDLYI